MPSIKLTALAVAALPRGNHFDAACPGLIVRVGKRRRTFAYRWRAGGRNPCIVLGHFPAISLAQARALAREAALRIDSGTAPFLARPHPRSTNALSLGALLDRYEAMRLSDGRRNKTLRKRLMALRKDLAPYAGLPASAFGKADVRAIRDTMLARGATVQWNRVRGTLRVFLQWAVEEDLVEANPVLAVRPAAERSRTRVLSAAEIRIVWRACEAFPAGFGVGTSFSRAIRFILLTALRAGEAGGIRYRDVIDGRLTIPETKNGRPHSLRLPPLALELLGQGEPNDLAFPGTGGKPLSWPSPLVRLQRACPQITERWHIHDLRRTCATHLQRLDVRPDVVEAVLNHALPGISGVGSVYMRGELEQQKADALQLWADEVQRIIGTPTVTPLRAVS